MSLGGTFPRRLCCRPTSNSAVLLKSFSSAPLLRSELPTNQSSDSPSPSPSSSEGSSSHTNSDSNPFPQVPATVKTRTIVGTVSRIHANTAYVEHNEQVWDKRLQKHFKKTAHNLVHDPTSLLRVGDVVRYSVFTPDEQAAREKHRSAILDYEESKGVKTGRGQYVTRKGFVVPDGKRLVMVGAKLEAVPKKQRNSKGVRFVAREVVSPFGSSISQRFGGLKKAGWLQDLQKRGFHSYSAARMAAINATPSAPADAYVAEVEADAEANTDVSAVQRDFRDRLHNAKSPEERTQIFQEIIQEHRRHVAGEKAKHGQNFVYEPIYIASPLVPGIVGAGWSIRDQLQRESGATIRNPKTVPTSGRHQVKQFDVYGSKEAVDKARDLIRERLESELEKIRYLGNWAGKTNIPGHKTKQSRTRLGSRPAKHQNSEPEKQTDKEPSRDGSEAVAVA